MTNPVKKIQSSVEGWASWVLERQKLTCSTYSSRRHLFSPSLVGSLIGRWEVIIQGPQTLPSCQLLRSDTPRLDPARSDFDSTRSTQVPPCGINALTASHDGCRTSCSGFRRGTPTPPFSLDECVVSRRALRFPRKKAPTIAPAMSRTATAAPMPIPAASPPLNPPLPVLPLVVPLPAPSPTTVLVVVDCTDVEAREKNKKQIASRA